MSSVNYIRGARRWRVSWSTAQGRKTRQFATEAEAHAFVAAGLPDETARGRNGRHRSAEDVAAFIRANSREDENGCHQWTRPLTKDGYPRLTWLSDDGYVIRGAHRLAYHLFVAKVPNDHLMSVDHLCRNRGCVNPLHLELVRQRENVLRSPIAPGATNAAKTHCPSGHPYSAENTYVYTFKTKRTTTRVCRTCQRAYHQKYQERRRAARKAASA